MTERKKPRVFRWVFLGVQVLFLIATITGVSGASGGCHGKTGDALQACQAGASVGTGIGVGLIIGLWLAVDAILAVTYLIFRRK